MKWKKAISIVCMALSLLAVTACGGQQAAQNGENHQQRQCDDEEQRGGDFGKAPGDMKRQSDRFDEKPDKNKNDKQGKHTIYLLFSVCRYKLQTGKPPSMCRGNQGCLRQHRTIPA